MICDPVQVGLEPVAQLIVDNQHAQLLFATLKTQLKKVRQITHRVDASELLEQRDHDGLHRIKSCQTAHICATVNISLHSTYKLNMQAGRQMHGLCEVFMTIPGEVSGTDPNLLRVFCWTCAPRQVKSGR